MKTVDQQENDRKNFLTYCKSIWPQLFLTSGLLRCGLSAIKSRFAG
jgi:hypothetical protein